MAMMMIFDVERATELNEYTLRGTYYTIDLHFDVSFRRAPSLAKFSHSSLSRCQHLLAVHFSMVKVFKPSKVAIVLSYVALQLSPAALPRADPVPLQNSLRLGLAVVSLAARSSLSASRMREPRWAIAVQMLPVGTSVEVQEAGARRQGRR
jgi:hypothetical protein